MKKISLIFSIFIVLMCFTSCGGKTLNSTDGSSNNKKTNITSNTPNNGTISNTKVTPYLPPYVNNLTPDNNYPPSKENNGYNIALYTIKNITSDEIFKSYEAILKNDGWTIYQDIAGHSISAKKGDHDATVIIQQSGKNVKLTVNSK